MCYLFHYTTISSIVLILRGNTGFSLVVVTSFEEKLSEKKW